MLTQGRGLAHISIFVKDIEITNDFYCNKLGFKKIWERDQNTADGLVRSSFLELGNLQLEILQIENVTYPADGCIQHIAIGVEDIEKAYQEIKAMGIECTEIAADAGVLTGSKWFCFNGPDGEHLEMNHVD